MASPICTITSVDKQTLSIALHFISWLLPLTKISTIHGFNDQLHRLKWAEWLSSSGSHQGSQDGCLQIHAAAREEEAVQSDALSAEGLFLAIPPAFCAAQGSQPYRA